jgi:type II secretion system protein G
MESSAYKHELTHFQKEENTMSITAFAARRRGFTLIELLIVIVVIAILALIVIPRVMGASRKAKESSLRGNLQELRNALEQFQADTGAYPQSLTDLVDTQANAPTTGEDGLGGTSVNIPAGSYKGPYLSPQGGIDNSGIPINPFVVTNPTGTTLAQADCDASWTYSQGLVHVAIPASGSTLDNIPYQSL